jgi:hypothetical protein
MEFPIVDLSDEGLRAENERLKREARGYQEMLAQVLQSVGEPVVVNKEQMQRGMPNGTQISVDDDIQREQFVFSLVFPE